MSMYFPPAGFRFSVNFSGMRVAEDASFSEVSGLEVERPMLEIREGGENRFSHRVPERAKFPNLVLKRGLMVWRSDLARWCNYVFESDLSTLVVPRDLEVALLNESMEPLMTWSVTRAWPLKWSLGGLAAERNELAIETLELAYAGFTRKFEPAGQNHLLEEDDD